MSEKNKCPKCGGRLVAEYIGSYGDVYVLKKNGKPYKRKMKRFIYENDGQEPMVYCLDCGNSVEINGGEVG